MLEEIKQDTEQDKNRIETKNKQLFDLKNILKEAKTSYQEVTKENKQLKKYITNIKQRKYQQQQQQIYSKSKKYRKVVYE